MEIKHTKNVYLCILHIADFLHDGRNLFLGKHACLYLVLQRWRTKLWWWWLAERCSSTHERESQKNNTRTHTQRYSYSIQQQGTASWERLQPQNKMFLAGRFAATLSLSLRCRLWWYLLPVTYVWLLTDIPKRRTILLLCLNIIIARTVTGLLQLQPY